MAAKEQSNFKIAADNRRARYEFAVGDVIEAGISLTGSEVKSLRSGKATIAESYVGVTRAGNIELVNANIPEYLQANRMNHEPRRPRRLLLKAREIARLAHGVEREGMTIVPLKLYFNEKGRAKIEIALAKGKKLHDKRATLKENEPMPWPTSKNTPRWRAASTSGRTWPSLVVGVLGKGRKQCVSTSPLRSRSTTST